MRTDVVGMRSARCLGLVVILVVSAPRSFTPAALYRAAEVGKLEGHVRDSTGLPMPSAQVWIDGTAYGGAADSQGHYFIDNIPPQVVDLTVTMVGYKRVQLKGIRILKGNTIAQDFSLEPIASGVVSVAQSATPMASQAPADSQVVVVAADEEKKKLNVGRIATGLLTEIGSAVIDSAKRAIVGRLLGNESKGLLGLVTSKTGQPIAGAKIDVDGAASVLTDSDGRFQIQPPVGRKFTLRVSAPGYGVLEAPLDKLKGGEGRRVSLRLNK